MNVVSGYYIVILEEIIILGSGRGRIGRSGKDR